MLWYSSRWAADLGNGGNSGQGQEPACEYANTGCPLLQLLQKAGFKGELQRASQKQKEQQCHDEEMWNPAAVHVLQKEWIPTAGTPSKGSPCWTLCPADPTVPAQLCRILSQLPWPLCQPWVLCPPQDRVYPAGFQVSTDLGREGASVFPWLAGTLLWAGRAPRSQQWHCHGIGVCLWIRENLENNWVILTKRESSAVHTPLSSPVGLEY